MAKNNDTRKRLQSVIGQLIDLKQDKIKLIPALVGTYDELGNEIVDVPSRLGFIYCRIAGDFSEIVQVFNESTIFPEFDLKVLIYKEANLPFYKLYGRDLAQYAQWDNTIFLPFHGNTHSFGSGENEGSDPTFIFKRQILQPMAVIPTSTGSMRAFVEPDYYSWNGVIQYFEGSETVDFTSGLPSEGARFITVYLNGNTNTLAYKTGSTFNGTDPTITGINSYIPTVNLSEGIALASVYLEFNTSEIDWDSLYDLRNFLNDGGASAGLGLHTLDPIGGFHSGTLRSSVVTVLDTNNYFTGTVVEDVLAELYNRTLAAGTSGTLPILDDSVFKITGTSLSFDDSLGVVVTGSRAYIFFTGSTASKIAVLDVPNYFTGTNVEQVLAELYNRQSQPGISGLYIYDDSVFKVTGTAISFDSGLGVTVTGSTAYVSLNAGAIGLHTLDPDAGFHSGTLQAKYVAVADVPQNIYTGINAEQIFQEIGEWAYPSNNLIKNGSFEFWDTANQYPLFYTALTGSSIARIETGTVKRGTKAMALVGVADIYYPSLLIDNPHSRFDNKVFTLACWVYRTGTGSTYIALANAPQSVLTFHSGTGWEYLRATTTILSPGNTITCQMSHNTTGTISIFDGFSLTEGAHVTDFAPHAADDSSYAKQILIEDLLIGTSGNYYTGSNVEQLFGELATEYPPQNYVKNGSFEFWADGLTHPLYYTGSGVGILTRESTLIKHGNYAVRIPTGTTLLAGDESFDKIFNEIDGFWLKDQIINLSAWMYYTGAISGSSANLQLVLNETSRQGLIYHGATGWEYLETSINVTGSYYTGVKIRVSNAGGTLPLIVDALSLTIGPRVNKFIEHVGDGKSFAQQIRVEDRQNLFTGTNVEQVLNELWFRTTGTGSSSGLTLIQNVKLSSNVRTVGFTSIPSTYKDLVIKAKMRSSVSATSEALHMRFNGNTGTNYDWSYTQMGSNIVGGARGVDETQMTIGLVAGATSPVKGYSDMLANIIDYTDPSNLPTINGIQTLRLGLLVADQKEQVFGGTYDGSGSLTDFTLYPATGNFLSGSYFSLYGLT